MPATIWVDVVGVTVPPFSDHARAVNDFAPVVFALNHQVADRLRPAQTLPSVRVSPTRGKLIVTPSSRVVWTSTSVTPLGTVVSAT